MEYNNQVKDFIHRCEQNLNLIKTNDGYEFTQLLNNFISALIFVKENAKINSKPLAFNNLSCRIISNSYPKDLSQDTSEFIRHLRNSCCHYGINILSKGGDINKVIFEDKDDWNGYCCKFEMKIEEIENTYKFLINYV